MSEAALQLPVSDDYLDGVAVDEIGRKAAIPHPKWTPDQVIQRELRRAGVGGTYKTSERFRVVYAACAAAWLRARAALALEITPELLWQLYDEGVSQHMIARRVASTQTHVRDLSQDLGFRLERSPTNGLRFRPSQGPCLGCGRVIGIERLDDAHRCEDCR